MKLLPAILTLTFLGTLQASTIKSCAKPEGIYISIEQAVTSLVYNTTVSVPDLCKEGENQIDCVNEVLEWVDWVECSYPKFTKHCQDYADKENFLSGHEEEHEQFMNRCVTDNYKTYVEYIKKLNQ